MKTEGAITAESDVRSRSGDLGARKLDLGQTNVYLAYCYVHLVIVIHMGHHFLIPLLVGRMLDGSKNLIRPYWYQVIRLLTILLSSDCHPSQTHETKPLPAGGVQPSDTHPSFFRPPRKFADKRNLDLSKAGCRLHSGLVKGVEVFLA